MARSPKVSHSWSLDPVDPLAVPNARITLALLRCVRRLAGTFPEHNFDDLGSLIAPILEQLSGLLRAALKAHFLAASPRWLDAHDIDLDGEALLHDRQIHTLLGESLARGTPRFKPLFDKAETLLARFVAKQAHPLDLNIETLRDLLSLPPPEVTYLTLAAAFCSGSISRDNFSFIDSPARMFKSIETLCEVKGAQAMRIFDSDRPLARSGLFDGIASERRRNDLEGMLRLSAVGERLLSAPFSDAAEMSAAVLTPLPVRDTATKLDWPHLAKAQTLLSAALAESILRGTPGFNVLFHGAPGTGKTEFARQLVADIGATGFAIDHTDDSGGEGSRSDRLASLRLSQSFAGQRQRSVLVLDEAEDIFENDYQHPFARLFKRKTESKAWMNNLLETNSHPVIWISNQVGHLDPAYLRRFAFCLEFPKTPLSLRRRIAGEQLLTAGCTPQTIEAVAASEHMTPALLASAVDFARLSTSSGLGPDLAVRTQLDEHAKAAGLRAPPLSPRRANRFDLRYLNVDGNATPVRLLQSLKSEPAAAIMFCGPPGTGKTQFAAEIASQLGRQLIVRTASDINTKWYGESEANVARMFRECDPQAELLFLDEAEVLLGSRDATTHRADRAVTAEFLRWLEVFEGTFVCATNLASEFDAALMRRFTFRLDFKPLDADQRQAMYAELALGWRPDDGLPRPNLDGAAISRLAQLAQLTPGDFANAARRVQRLGLDGSQWLDELEAEHRAKGCQSQSHIGFV